MRKFISLGHISIVVDNIEQAGEFYQDHFGAIPLQDFPYFKNPIIAELILLPQI